MDEKRAYEIAGKILEGHCVQGIEPHKVKQIADKIVSVLVKQIRDMGNLYLLNSIVSNLEYAAYNLLDGRKDTELHEGIIDSTDAGDTLLIAIRELKEIVTCLNIVLANKNLL